MKDRLIIALDVASVSEARRIVRLLRQEISIFKVGLQLYTLGGPDVIRMVHDEGGKVFLDLKFHDIPNTVARACEAAASLGVFMMNLHASGGREMLEAAVASVKNLKKRPILLGVTVLTSRAVGGGLEELVVSLASLCRDARLDGVVCSAFEAAAVRKRCGQDFVIVTPGIRPAGSLANDQKRIATPSEAVSGGADYLVVGRPVLTAKDPIEVVRSLMNEIQRG